MKKKDGLQQLMDLYLRLMPEGVLLTKDKERHEEVKKAVEEIANFALDICPDADIKVYQDELTGSSICMRIVTDLFVAEEIDKFCSALKKANNFEVYPLTNGKIALGLVFEGVFKPAPPINKN